MELRGREDRAQVDVAAGAQLRVCPAAAWAPWARRWMCRGHMRVGAQASWTRWWMCHGHEGGGVRESTSAAVG